MRIWALYSTNPLAMFGEINVPLTAEGAAQFKNETFEMVLRYELSDPSHFHTTEEIREALEEQRGHVWMLLQDHCWPFRSMAVGDVFAAVDGETVLYAWRCQNVGWCDVDTKYLDGRVRRHEHFLDYSMRDLEAL